MSKSKKVEKETRRLMESISDLVKKKGDHYKFKSKKKKLIKKVRKSCVHWIYRHGKEVPTVIQDPQHPGYWRCMICGKIFPIQPLQSTQDGKNGYQVKAAEMLSYVNQMQFWSVKLGGDADDTKMFLELKKLLPRFGKVSKQILKRVNQRNEFEESRKKGTTMPFDKFQGYSYRP